MTIRASWTLGRSRRSQVIRSVTCGLLAIALGTAGASCSRPPLSKTGLEGEWEVILEYQPYGLNARRARLQGTFVFDSALPAYGLEMPQKTSLGRAYVELTAPIRAGEVRRGPYYARGGSADLLEEINATEVSPGVYRMEISPQIFGRDPVLEVTARGDRLVGRWMYFSHSDTVGTGSVFMRRTPRSEATDSARSRARRAADQWHAAATVAR
jgi:hypothetical protein